MVTHKSVCYGGKIHGDRGRIVHEENLKQLPPFAVHVAVVLQGKEEKKNAEN